MASAMAVTTSRLSMVWIVAPRACPDSTARREMAMVRNRAMMPSVMSVATEMAVPVVTAATAISRMPGTTYWTYALRPPAAPRRPAPRVPPRM